MHVGSLVVDKSPHASALDNLFAVILKSGRRKSSSPLWHRFSRDLGEYFPEHPPREAQTLEVVSEIGTLRQSTLGADGATALAITDAQQAGLRPPKYAFAPPKKIVTRVDPAPPRSTYR
jgi:hypothetical protein